MSSLIQLCEAFEIRTDGRARGSRGWAGRRVSRMGAVEALRELSEVQDRLGEWEYDAAAWCEENGPAAACFLWRGAWSGLWMFDGQEFARPETWERLGEDQLAVGLLAGVFDQARGDVLVVNASAEFWEAELSAQGRAAFLARAGWNPLRGAL